MRNNVPVKLLWTGGWDSSYRLLEIVLEEKKEVQPYYIIFKKRWSSKMELKTMQEIKNALIQKHPQSRELIHNTVVVREEEIIEDETVKDLYYKLKKKCNLGNQYKTIACFAKQYNLMRLELGFTKYRLNLLKKYIKNHDLVSVNELDRSVTPEYLYEFFKYFNFPLLHYSKSEMGVIANNKGWKPILDKTWICHKPIFGKYPCGGCNPCIQAANDEFTKRRIPLISRLIGPKIKKIYNSRYFMRMRKTSLTEKKKIL